MAAWGDIASLLLFLAVAFIPSIFYLVSVRNAERFGRVPYRVLLGPFLWGVTFAVVFALIAEFAVVYLLGGELVRQYELLQDPTVVNLLLAIVVAPFAEEFSKALGVLFTKRRIVELEDGIILGAASGLGFAATENLFYELTALASFGFAAYIATAVVRSISSTLLHASATATTGYGIGRKVFRLGGWGGFYLLAVLMHASFNLIASLGVILADTYGEAESSMLSLLFAVLMAWIAWRAIRTKVRELDLQARRAPTR